MKVVVIGGTGHVGTYLIPWLVDLGYEVCVISRGNQDLYLPHVAWNHVERLAMDRSQMDEEGTFASKVVDLKPDIVIDMVCFSLESARQLVEALRGKVQHYLFAGSVWAHGHSEVVPTVEEQPKKPFGNYGIQKAAIEDYLIEETKRNGFPATTFHPGHIVGQGWAPVNPAGHKHPSVFEVLARGEELALPNFGQETVHHVHAEDVAQVIIKSIQNWSNAIGQAFFAVSPAAVSLRGYAMAAASWFGQKANLKFLPWEEWESQVGEKRAKGTYSHIVHSPCCSIEKGRRLLDYKPRYSSLQACRQSVEWLIENEKIDVPKNQVMMV